jgi:hypothetical protein
MLRREWTHIRKSIEHALFELRDLERFMAIVEHRNFGRVIPAAIRALRASHPELVAAATSGGPSLKGPPLSPRALSRAAKR